MVGTDHDVMKLKCTFLFLERNKKKCWAFKTDKAVPEKQLFIYLAFNNSGIFLCINCKQPLNWKFAIFSLPWKRLYYHDVTSLTLFWVVRKIETFNESSFTGAKLRRFFVHIAGLLHRRSVAIDIFDKRQPLKARIHFKSSVVRPSHL